MYLTIRTDSPTPQLALHSNNQVVDEEKWEAHRELSDQLLRKIEDLLKRNKLEFTDIKGVVVFAGPGSFTGLRIGITVANTLAYSLEIPIVGAQEENWQTAGAKKLNSGENQQIVTPFYGGEPNITKPRK